jgi:hypothetical protein
MIQRYLISLLLSLALCTSASAAVKATTIQFLLNQQRTAVGSLAGGTVECYASGTSTLKTIWLDRDKADTAANPYTLDANGTAQLYGDGVYRVVIKDAAGNVKYDRSGLAFQDLSTNGMASILDYGTLAEAVAAIGSTPKTLAYGTDQTVSANLTIPATLELMPLNGAIITVNSGKTLTINSPFSVGDSSLCRFRGSSHGPAVKGTMVRLWLRHFCRPLSWMG